MNQCPDLSSRREAFKSSAPNPRSNPYLKIVSPVDQQTGFMAGENVMIFLQKLMGLPGFRFFPPPE